MPGVSILIPATGSAAELGRSIDACLRSSALETEIVVAGPAVADLPDDPRIVATLVDASTVGALVRRALESATGAYVVVLFPGDVLDPIGLEVLVDRATRERADLVLGGSIAVDPAGHRSRTRLRDATARFEGRIAPSDPWVATIPVAAAALLVRRDLASRPDVGMADDDDATSGALRWHLGALFAADRAYAVDYPVVERGVPAADAARVLAVYESLERQHPAHASSLLVHAFLACGRASTGRAAASARDDVRRLFARVRARIRTTGGLSGDPDFDEWAALETRHAVRRIDHRGLQRFWRFSPRRMAKVTARRAGALLHRRIARMRDGRLGPILNIALRGRLSRGPMSQPAIPQPRGFVGRNALVIVPWSDDNGSTQVIDLLNGALRDLGYRIHVVVSNRSGPNRARAGWDETYDLGDSPHFGRLVYADGSVVLDGHGVDDWAGDDLLQFVADADRAWRFDVVVCHYVFFSRALEAVNRDATTILVTHDRFAGRNSRFAERGMTASYFYSTTEDEEAIGVRRADHVVALQEHEAAYFATAVSGTPTRVHTLPLLDAPAFRDPPPAAARLRVGFLGSSYANNRTALVEFFRDVAGRDLSALEFVIAGNVCSTLSRADLPDAARLLGPVAEVDDFYSRVDVVFNPDFLESGRKVKVFEALAFGVPVVTTRESTAGFDGLPPDLTLTSSTAILERLIALAGSASERSAARKAGRAAYLELYERYRTGPLLRRMLGRAGEPTDIDPPGQAPSSGAIFEP